MTTCAVRNAGAAAAVGRGCTLLGFFKRQNATDEAKESPVLMDSSSSGGGDASDDADVVATGVVSRDEGGAGAGSDADVVATGVVNGVEGCEGAGSDSDVVAMGVVNRLEDCEGAGIDMDGVFSDTADGSGPADRTVVHAPIYCVGLFPAVREPVLQHYPTTLHGIGNQGVTWEARTHPNRVSLHAEPTAPRGILSPGCAGTVEQPGGTCAPCLDIKGTKATGVRTHWVTQKKMTSTARVDASLKDNAKPKTKLPTSLGLLLLPSRLCSPHVSVFHNNMLLSAILSAPSVFEVALPSRLCCPHLYAFRTTCHSPPFSAPRPSSSRYGRTLILGARGPEDAELGARFLDSSPATSQGEPVEKKV